MKLKDANLKQGDTFFAQFVVEAVGFGGNAVSCRIETVYDLGYRTSNLISGEAEVTNIVRKPEPIKVGDIVARKSSIETPRGNVRRMVDETIMLVDFSSLCDNSTDPLRWAVRKVEDYKVVS